MPCGHWSSASTRTCCAGRRHNGLHGRADRRQQPGGPGSPAGDALVPDCGVTLHEIQSEDVLGTTRTRVSARRFSSRRSDDAVEAEVGKLGHEPFCTPPPGPSNVLNRSRKARGSARAFGQRPMGQPPMGRQRVPSGSRARPLSTRMAVSWAMLGGATGAGDPLASGCPTPCVAASFGSFVELGVVTCVPAGQVGVLAVDARANEWPSPSPTPACPPSGSALPSSPLPPSAGPTAETKERSIWKGPIRKAITHFAHAPYPAGLRSWRTRGAGRPRTGVRNGFFHERTLANSIGVYVVFRRVGGLTLDVAVSTYCFGMRAQVIAKKSKYVSSPRTGMAPSDGHGVSRDREVLSEKAIRREAMPHARAHTRSPKSPTARYIAALRLQIGTPISKSIIGFDARPGTAVLPMCSIAGANKPKALLIRVLSSSNIIGQLGS